MRNIKASPDVTTVFHKYHVIHNTDMCVFLFPADSDQTNLWLLVINLFSSPSHSTRQQLMREERVFHIHSWGLKLATSCSKNKSRYEITL